MKNKLLMIFLILVFSSAIMTIVFYFLRTKSPTSISLPLPKATPSPYLNVPEATPTTADPNFLQSKAILDDLDKIGEDLSKLEQEDKRFVPPDLLFEAQIPE